MLKLIVVALGASVLVTSAFGTEVEFPRSMADKGRYYLLEKSTKAGIITTVHKRVGVNETGYSKTEINCSTSQYRDVGYGEGGPKKIKAVSGRWTDTLSGSSKSDLVSFVCARK